MKQLAAFLLLGLLVSFSAGMLIPENKNTKTSQRASVTKAKNGTETITAKLQIEKKNATSSEQETIFLAKTQPSASSNEMPNALGDSTNSAQITKTKETTQLTHIRRKREIEVLVPFDFFTLHLHCDMDITNRQLYMETMPNHCIWAYNNAFEHEGFFRIYRTYQTEAFFFGQFYERLKRFEIDPHSWDYTMF